MISEKMQKAFNEQLNAELYSSYLYLSMAAYFEAANLPGFANWMSMQSQEEYAHSMKFYSYINQVGGRVELDTIEKPDFEWKSALVVFEASLEHEKYITKRINDLVDLAIEGKDHAANNFLQWFVNEQVEEEATVGNIVDKFRLIGEEKGGLFILDRELGARQAE